MNAIEKMWTYINIHDQGEIDRPELYSMWNAVVDHVATEQAALERKLEAAERTIDSLRHVAHRAVSHVGAANYAECEQEAHDWIDAA